MPTAGEFESVADGLHDLIGDLEDLAYPLENRMGAHVLEGGELTDSVYESIKTTRVLALSLSGVVAEYRAEVVRRLEEARAAVEAKENYEEDMATYRAHSKRWENQQNGIYQRYVTRLKEEPTPPDPPPPPADYIDL